MKAPDRWVSCAKDVNVAVAHHRHIVRRGGLSTACGSTASTPDVWRGNGSKPKCPSCLTKAADPDNTIIPTNEGVSR